MRCHSGFSQADWLLWLHGIEFLQFPQQFAGIASVKCVMMNEVHEVFIGSKEGVNKLFWVV